jgi:phenylalanyl-tRNA synthetase alpha chain
MSQGTLHPITHVLRVAVSAFGDMGFDIVDAPEVDTAWYNFDSLRMPEDHPARLGQDSFWLKDGRLLRTQTTNMQLHATEQKRPPIRVMHFGPCYRNDATDITHDVIFTQLDCLAIDEGITLANLLSTLETFIIRLFGTDVKYRFRPHNFPFTEPSVEVDIWHNGKWIELLGAGMVHPEVLKNMQIDPSKYSGFAFGIGIDRIAMFKWGVEDVRQLHMNKLSFLRQFKAPV